MAKLHSLAVAVLCCLAARGQVRKEWKSQFEYDLGNATSKSSNPQERLELLNKWQQGFPQSDFGEVRDYLFVVTYQQLNDCRNAIDASADILKTRPNNFTALSAIVSCIYTMIPPPAADLDIAETASRYLLDNLDAVFNEGNNPPGMAKDQFMRGKQPMRGMAQRTLGFVSMGRKDHAKAETELLKALQLDPTYSQFAYSLGGELLAQQAQDPGKGPRALFYYARAAAYDGPNSMPAASRKAAGDYLARVYSGYHGSSEGFEALLTLAKNNSFPPEGFRILSAVDLENIRLDRIGLWNGLRRDLTAPKGDEYFKKSVHETLIPGGWHGVKEFQATVAKSAKHGRELRLTMPEAKAPEVKLVLRNTPEGPLKKGALVEFHGVPERFTRSPFLLTVDGEITGSKPAPPRSSSNPFVRFGKFVGRVFATRN